MADSWLDCGLAMILPFLPLRAAMLRLLVRGENGGLQALDIATPAQRPELWHRDVQAAGPLTALSADAPLMPPVGDADAPRVLAVLPSMTAGRSWTELRSLARRVEAEMRPRDVLVVVTGSRLPQRWLRRVLPDDALAIQGPELANARPLAFLGALAACRSRGVRRQLFVCVDRLGGGRRRLVPAAWRGQRRFARSGVTDSGRLGRMVWRITAWAGLYPLLQPEHLVVVQKC